MEVLGDRCYQSSWLQVIVEAPEAGYHVRASVRRIEQIATIKALPSVQSHIHKLELVVVPDISTAGTYDEAFQGATYAIYVAAPLATPVSTNHEFNTELSANDQFYSDNYAHDIIEPSVKGTTGILTSAIKVPTVKRFVIASSLNALLSWEDIAVKESDKDFSDEYWETSNNTRAELTYFQTKTQLPIPEGPHSHYFKAYSASKMLALHATEVIIEANKPSLDVINIMPPFIIGKNEFITDVKNIESGNNAFALASLRRYKNPPSPRVTVYLNDVTKVHVLALDPKIWRPRSYENFMISSLGRLRYRFPRRH